MRVGNSINDISKFSNNNLNSSWGIRAAFWIITWDALKEHPFGYGLGGYKMAIKEQINKKDYSFIDTKSKEFMSNMHPHNQYLLTLLQSGFIGLLLFLNIIYQLLVYKIKDREIKELSILFTTIFFVSCLAEPLLIKQFTLVLFVLFIGLFTIDDSTKQKLQY
jgi:O-antigen ligase